MENRYSLVLASQSPRRYELLKYLKIPFEVITADINEQSNKKSFHDLAIDLASKKSDAVMNMLTDKRDSFPLVVAGDTIVVCQNEIMGKPKDITGAKKMLLKLSAKEHEVLTGISMRKRDRINHQINSYQFSVSTKVTCSKIHPDLLENYLLTKDSLDKAGAYGIQNGALTFIHKIEGSYSNVVGFPLSDFVKHLKSFLGHVENSSDWKKEFLSLQ